ncbi:hypothetical protein [Lignipirellula cremea]|uniref:Uncharacterized protein n=1 Tax=Lignipirellula cremea TaxID=2528010 RepID=A0A518E2E8_9BACT|nr:hypothetical protein [Lignipirellula cremea]QDU98232.1 hypothetical protein Pla8534_60930 [Lignipirellula cremea]
MTDHSDEIAQLSKTRTFFFLGAVLVGGTTLLKATDIFSAGFLPPWLGGILVLLLIGAALRISVKIDKLQRQQD